MKKTQPILEVSNLRIIFGENEQKRIIDDVDFFVNKGEILGIVGESGSGKTQSVLATLGIQSRSPGMVSGSIKYHNSFLKGNVEKKLLNNNDWKHKNQNKTKFIDSIELTDDLIKKYIKKEKNNQSTFYAKDDKMWKKCISNRFEELHIRGSRVFLMFQDPKSYLNPFWTIRKQFEHLLPSTQEQKSIINKVMKRFNLEPVNEVLDKYPHQLSGGMNQRVMIALGAAIKPEIIIADEITTGLDLINQVAVVEHLKELKKEHKQTIIIISHDIGFIQKLADKILVMYNGQGVEFGYAKDILNLNTSYKHPYTKQLIEIFQGVKDYIPGEPPKRYKVEKGCRFHTRCEDFLNNRNRLYCDKKAPEDFLPFENYDENIHRVRCKLFNT